MFNLRLCFIFASHTSCQLSRQLVLTFLRDIARPWWCRQFPQLSIYLVQLRIQCGDVSGMLQRQTYTCCNGKNPALLLDNGRIHHQKPTTNHVANELWSFVNDLQAKSSLPGIVRFPVLNFSSDLAAGTDDVSGCVAGFDDGVDFWRDILSCESRSLRRLLSFSITDVLRNTQQLQLPVYILNCHWCLRSDAVDSRHTSVWAAYWPQLFHTKNQCKMFPSVL